MAPIACRCQATMIEHLFEHDWTPGVCFICGNSRPGGETSKELRASKAHEVGRAASRRRSRPDRRIPRTRHLPDPGSPPGGPGCRIQPTELIAPTAPGIEAEHRPAGAHRVTGNRTPSHLGAA